MVANLFVLVAVSVFAFASVFTTAEVPAYCYQIPQPGFPDGTNVQKWGFNHKKNICVEYVWNGDTSVKNYFDSKESCLNTCLPDASKNYTLIEGLCVCRCPKCGENDRKPGKVPPVKRHATLEPPRTSDSITPIVQAILDGSLKL